VNLQKKKQILCMDGHINIIQEPLLRSLDVELIW